MRLEYRYWEINDRLVSTLHRQLKRDHSVVLLGRRDAGKSYVVDLVNEMRVSEQALPLPKAVFGKERLITQEKEAAGLLAQACGLSAEIFTLDAWAQAVRAKHAADGSRAHLAVVNVDGMSRSLTHRFLRHVFSLNDEMVYVLTGKYDLAELLSGGIDSPGRCPCQYVINAPDEKHFRLYLNQPLEKFRLRLPADTAESDEIVKKLRHLTGGDVTLLRAVLWILSDRSALAHADAVTLPLEVRLDQLPACLTDKHIASAGGMLPFQSTVRVLEGAAFRHLDKVPSARGADQENSHEDILHQIEELLADRPVFVPSDAPHLLELTGFAKRDEFDRQLEWFSKYSEDFARRHFTPQRLGDLYALAHKWASAYRCYASIPSDEERRRPFSEEDHVTLMRIADAAAVHFHQRVGEDGALRNVKHAQGIAHSLWGDLCSNLKSLMGFDPARMSRWRLDSRGLWQSHTGDRTGADLPDFVQTKDGIPGALEVVTREENLSGYHATGYHWTVCRDPKNRVSSLVLVDAVNYPLSGKSLHRSVLFRIFSGYRRAVERLGGWASLRADASRQAAEAKIASEFWELTNANRWKPRDALARVAKTIREHFHSVGRVVFARMGHFEGTDHLFVPIYDSAAGNPQPPDFQSVRIPDEDYRNRLKGKAVYRFDAESGNRFLQDGSHHRLAHYRYEGALVRHFFTGGITVVEALGEEGLYEADLEALGAMAKRINKGWQQASRLAMLGASLDALGAPSLLFDHQGNIVYANQDAVTKLDLGPTIRHGWQHRPVTPAHLRELPGKEWKENSPKLLEALTPTLHSSVVRYDDLTSLLRDTWLRECTRIEAGWTMTFRTRAFLFKSFGMMQKLVAASHKESPIKRVARYVKELLLVEDAQLRLYLAEGPPRRLVGYRALGMASKEKSRRFEAGEIVFPLATRPDSWLCLKNGKPEVFKLVQKKTGHSPTRTKNGLDYTEIEPDDLDDALEKEIGDVWIDLPFFASDGTALGKMSISFRKKDVHKLTPEQPMVFGALAVLLSEFIKRFNEGKAREDQLQADSAHAMSRAVHKLKPILRVLSRHIGSYRAFEKDAPGLRAVTDDLQALYDSNDLLFERIMSMLGPIHLQPAPGNLAIIVRESLREPLSEVKYQVTEETPTDGLWDKDRWEDLFIEFAKNSIDFQFQGRPLQIRVDFRLIDFNGRQWLEIVYQDNGMGIPDKIKPVIFREESHREVLGTKASHGHGMAYARRMIRAHRGAIRERGEYGQGAKFIMRVPAPDPQTRLF